MGCVLLGLLISTGCRGCHRFLGGGYVVAAWVCRVYEVLSVSFGLVLIPCVNALACQRVGNLEFVGCYWRIPGTITSLALCVKACVMWNMSDVAGVFLALSLSLALCVYTEGLDSLFMVVPVHLFVVSLVCLLIVCTVTGYPTRCCLSLCV